MTSVALVCDLGGTSVRAGLVDASGVMLAESAVVGPALRDEGSRSEIDPEGWWRCLVETCSRLAAAAPTLFSQVEGIAICGVTRTQVFLDRESRVLRPALSWKDARADAIARRLREELAGHPEADQVNAFHPLARLGWLAEHEPDHLAKLACVLDPKDFLNARLTGRAASDPVSMARLCAAAAPAGGIDAFALLGLAPAILPALREPCEVVGPIMPGLPAPFDRLAGVPVFCAANDTWTAVLGLGAMRAGCAYNLSGTTEVFGLLGEAGATAEGLLTVDWRGLHQLGGPSQTGADTVSWLLSVVGGNAGLATGPAIEALLDGPRQPQPLLFLPYLQGERVPYWDPDLRGAFVGLQRRHGASDLAWAVLEGVAFLNRIVLERAEAAQRHQVAEIRFGGGGAANPHWCQVKADICGRPVVTGQAREPGLLGAAIIAWTGLGRFSSLAAAQRRLVKEERRFEPDPDRAAAYDRLFALFREAEAALAPVSHALAASTIVTPPHAPAGLMQDIAR